MGYSIIEPVGHLQCLAVIDCFHAIPHMSLCFWYEQDRSSVGKWVDKPYGTNGPAYFSFIISSGLPASHNHVQFCPFALSLNLTTVFYSVHCLWLLSFNPPPPTHTHRMKVGHQKWVNLNTVVDSEAMICHRCLAAEAVASQMPLTEHWLPQ